MDRGEADDEVLGIITRDEALERAREEGVDLVMIAEKSDPPVCKIVDYGKLRYQKDKKKKEQVKKAKTNEIKEVKTCVEINQCVGCTRQFFIKSFLGDDAGVPAPSSGDEPAPPRHRAGVASMAWRTTR